MSIQAKVHCRSRRALFSEISVWTTRVLLGAGIGLRIVLYLRNRSLWMDEAQLALNIIERGYRPLLKPLAYAQGAPLGFLWAEKLVGSIGRYQEYALRLIPLLAGIAGLYVLSKLAKIVSGIEICPVAVALVAFSPFCIHFSSEVKQYSTDMFFCGLVLLIMLRFASGVATLRAVLVTGILAMWLSHPAAFVVFGTIAVLVLRAHKLKQYQLTANTLKAFAAFALNLAILYAVSLRSLSRHGYMLALWTADFMPRLPHTLADLHWFIDHYLGFFRNPFGIAAYGGAFLFLIGCIALYRRRPFLFALLVSPLGPLLLACFLHKYPLSGRLVLFLVPIAAILIAEGIGAIANAMAFFIQPLRGRESVIVSLLLLAMLVEPGQAVSRMFLSPGGSNIEETRQVLEYVRAHSAGDELWYVDCVAKPAFLYYAHLERFGVKAIKLPANCSPDCLREDVARMRGERVWIITSHMPSMVLVKGGAPTAFSSEEVLTRNLERGAIRLRGIHISSGVTFYFGADIGTSAYLYDLRQMVPLSAPTTDSGCPVGN
jgi:hypothetical protein